MKTLLLSCLLLGYVLSIDFETNTAKLNAGLYQNKTTKMISKMVITCNDGELQAETYIGCTEKSCALKKVVLKSSKAKVYQAKIKKGFSTKVIKIEPLPNKIKVTITNSFSDGRPSRIISTILNRVQKFKC